MRKISKLTSLSLAALMVASVMPTAFAAETKLFENDFEKYSTQRETVTVWFSASKLSKTTFIKNYSGIASNTLRVLKATESNPFDETKGTVTTESDGVLSFDFKSGGNVFLNDIQKGNYYYEYVDSDKFEAGGLGEGYYGLSNKNGYPLATGSGSNSDNPLYSYDLCVIDDAGDKSLSLSPNNSTASVTDVPSWSMFGKGGLDINNKITRFKTDVKFRDNFNAGQTNDYSDGWRLSIVKNDKFDTFDYHPYDWMGANAQFFNKQAIEMYDAVVFRDGKVYLGPDIGTADSLKADRIVCDYDKEKYYTVEYYLDLKDISKPKHTVRILDGDKVVGYKAESFVADSEWTGLANKSFWTSLPNNNQSPQMYTANNNTNIDSPFTGFDAACTNYGVALSSAIKIGTPEYKRGCAAAYVDNFSAYTVDTVPEVNTEISGTVSDKAVAAKVSSLNALTNAQLIAAEYDGTTGRFIQYAKADVTAAANTVNQAVTVTFDKDLTANSKIKLFLWDSLNNIASLADSVTVR